MKKFERLSAEERKKEIKDAAIQLFLEKGFRATTMENIVANVSLSKGGVYRFYPSTTAILSDIIIDAANVRNEIYLHDIKSYISSGKQIDENTIADIIANGMLCYPEVAEIYVELLIEKRHIPQLEALYQEICKKSTEDIFRMIEEIGIQNQFLFDYAKLQSLTDTMNTAILGIVVLNHRADYNRLKPILKHMLVTALSETYK